MQKAVLLQQNYNSTLIQYIESKTKLDKVKVNMQTCSTMFMGLKCPHGCTHSIAKTCGVRYCKKDFCIEQRQQRYFGRLMKKDIRPKRLLHITLGYPYKCENAQQIYEAKKYLNKSFSKFRKKMASFNFKLYGYSVFDISATEFPHLHIALLPNGRFFTKLAGSRSSLFFQKSQQIIQQVSKGQLKQINFVGMRSKYSLFDYMSKRESGVYGHCIDNGGYSYLQNFMSLEEYIQYFHKSRFLNIYLPPKAVSLYSRTESTVLKCEKHNLQYQFCLTFPKELLNEFLQGRLSKNG